MSESRGTEIISNNNEDSTNVGMFAISRAGHDIGHRYIIIREMQDYVYLADGDLRTVDNPKRKNRKHIQIIRKGAGTVIKNKLQNNQPVNNEEIKYIIKINFK